MSNVKFRVMANQEQTDRIKYEGMQAAGMSQEDIFLSCKADGYLNWQCIALVSNLFNISTDEARELSHLLWTATETR